MNFKNVFIYSFFLLALFTGACKNGESDSNTEQIENNDSLSIDYISSLIRKTPKDASLFHKRSKLYLKEANIKEAINDITIATRLDSVNPEYRLTAAEYYLIRGKSGKAKNELTKSLKFNPENTEILLKLAEIYLLVKDYKKSTEYLNKVYKYNSGSPKLYFLRALIAKENKDTNKTIENLHIAIEKNPEFYDAYILLGLEYANKKDSMAIEFYNNAINLKPTEVEPYYNLAMYYQENNRFINALSVYKKIINDIDSNYIYAYYNTAYNYLVNLNDYDKAIEYFEKTIEMDSSYVDAIYNLGYSYEKKGDYKTAEEYYNIALKKVTNYQKAIEGLNRIDKHI